MSLKSSSQELQNESIKLKGSGNFNLLNLEYQDDSMIWPEAYQKHCMIIGFNQLRSSTDTCSQPEHRILNMKSLNSHEHQFHVGKLCQDSPPNVFKLNGCELLQ